MTQEESVRVLKAQKMGYMVTIDYGNYEDSNWYVFEKFGDILFTSTVFSDVPLEEVEIEKVKFYKQVGIEDI